MRKIKDIVTKEDNVYVEIRELNTYDTLDFFGALLFKGKAKHIYDACFNERVLKAIWHENSVTIIVCPTDINMFFRDDYVAVKMWSDEDVKEIIRQECDYDVDEIFNHVNTRELEILEDCTDDEWNQIRYVVDKAIKNYEEKGDAC